MLDIIEQVYQFNKDAGLLNNGYDDFLESSFQIEEALEGLDTDAITKRLAGDVDDKGAKEIARFIASIGTHKQVPNSNIILADVDRLDKACDAIVFALGSMAKLGLTPAQINQALNIVMTANQAKLSCPKDEHGKLTKPDNFPNPEPLLQSLLDERDN